jgi:hypothetical protein
MAPLGLNSLNRIFLLAWTAGVGWMAARTPTVGPLPSPPAPGPLAAVPVAGLRYGALALVWLVGVVGVLAWQRTLWTTMGAGAGFRAETAHPLSLPRLTTTARGRTITAETVRRGWSPLATLRVEAALETTDPAAVFELEITTDGDPAGRVLFEAPDADRRYVLTDGGGDVESVLTTDFRAELLEVETPGTLAVVGSHARYDVAQLPFDAARLSTCARTTVRLAEQVEAASGNRRGVD